MANFKIYIGMSAGVGKTYRMLQEAHVLLNNGMDIRIGYVETHQRKETEAMLRGLPMIPRRKLFYKGKELEEMDLNLILATKPEIVVVDELAHTNIEGSKNEKRWQDVLDLLQAGIHVISAVNIQHIESLNEEVKRITGIEVRERIPDKILQMADEVVNIDLTATELITRLREGKIYTPEKVPLALANFFTSQNILQLRELALKEVATQVERKVDLEVSRGNLHHERLMACISANEKTAKGIIRKTARLANYFNAKWFVLYVQTPQEEDDLIALDKQRHLINNFKLATELGAEIVRVKSSQIAQSIATVATQKQITTLCIGKPHLSMLKILWATPIFNDLLKKLASNDIDIVIIS